MHVRMCRVRAFPRSAFARPTFPYHPRGQRMENEETYVAALPSQQCPHPAPSLLRFHIANSIFHIPHLHVPRSHVRASHSCKTLEVRMRFSDAIRTCGAGEVCCQRGISGEDLKGQARLRRSHVHVRAFAPKPLRSPGNVSGMCIVSCRRRGAAAVPGRWWEASRVGRVLYSPSSFPMCRLRSGGNVSGACTVAYR